MQGEGTAAEQRRPEGQNDLQAYCVQCMTGYEIRVSERIGQLHPGITTLAVIQEKHQSVNGVKGIKRQVMLPGYVFIFSGEPIPYRHILPMQHVIRFLTYGQGEDLALRGDDLAFAQWVQRHEGLMGCSRAVQVGSSLRIIEGPLRDHIGTVEKIDRHNRNVCLDIIFSGNHRRVWMPFLWAEEAESTQFSNADNSISDEQIIAK